MTKYIVHIGDGKCGSSSIQTGLYQYREQLRAMNIIYETSAPNNGHFDLVSCLGKQTRGSSEQTLQKAQASIQMMKDALTPGCTVLLSAESFFNLPPQNLIKILRMISPDIEQLDLIAYVRAPHNMYLSLVQQTIKADSKFPMPDQYARRIDRILAGWQALPQANRLTVRNFDRNHLIDGDVVPDFTRTLRDLTGRDDIELPKVSVNTTLSAEQLVVLQEYRGTFLKQIDGKAHQDSQILISYFENLNDLGFPGSKPVLTDRAVTSLRKSNAGILKSLSNFFPTLVLTIPDKGKGEVNSHDPEWDADGSVTQILKQVDQTMQALLRRMVSKFDRGVPRSDIRAMVRDIRALGEQHRFNAQAVLEETVAFWRGIPLPKRTDILEAQITDETAEALSAQDTESAELKRHPMVLYGKGDWLFLKADSNRVMEQIAGTYLLKQNFEQKWQDLFIQRAAMAKEKGFQYFYGIAPNKECVYADQLPDGITVTNNRPIRKVLDEAIGRVSHLYYLDALLAKRAEGEDVFVTGDTHWNHIGAFVAFNEALRTLGLPLADEDDYNRKIREIKADLSTKMGLLCPATVLTVKNPKFKIVEDNQVNNVGHRRVYENEDKSLPSCVFFRDSFTSHQLDMFATKFSRIVYLWQPNIDYAIVDAETPDFVINQQVERFLVECPDDLNGPSHEEYVRRKREG